MSSKRKEKEDDTDARIAIVEADRCKPKKCQQECKRFCPVVKSGKSCVVVTKDSKISQISEILCIGCGICVKKCPFDAIKIIKLPKSLHTQTTHRYGPNSFKLHRLPMPRPGQVLGLVGINGIGKSTALKVLAGKLKPNLGRFDDPPEWSQLLQYFRGSELQSYFNRLLDDKLKAIIKPQYVDNLPKQIQGTLGEILRKKDEKGKFDEIVKELDLGHLLDRAIDQLSGGELQRFAIAVCCVQSADVYMFDEPSSYLDVKQRIKVAKVIRSLIKDNNFIVVVEHDLSVLDYLSDFVCVLWGSPGAYGVVTAPYAVREGINIFLEGFAPTDNTRFRDTPLTFKVQEQVLEKSIKLKLHKNEYPQMTKTLENFKLTIEQGDFSDSEIVVLLGQNGCGKTTFIRMLAGLLSPDDPSVEIPTMNVSLKPQKITAKFEGSVRDLFLTKIKDTFLHATFQQEVVKPLEIERLMDFSVQTLSGGELQRVALVLALGKPADVYLIDEPSAYLDSEQRLQAAKVIKRFIMSSKKTAFVVEHDFIMSAYLADKIIVYRGRPGIETTASSPQSVHDGMNMFLKDLGITFRRDPSNFRPRINKEDSTKDKEQKLLGMHYVMEE